jgi:hypothetical protein
MARSPSVVQLPASPADAFLSASGEMPIVLAKMSVVDPHVRHVARGAARRGRRRRAHPNRRRCRRRYHHHHRSGSGHPPLGLGNHRQKRAGDGPRLAQLGSLGCRRRAPAPEAAPTPTAAAAARTSGAGGSSEVVPTTLVQVASSLTRPHKSGWLRTGSRASRTSSRWPVPGPRISERLLVKSTSNLTFWCER